MIARQERVKKNLEGCIFKYGPFSNIDRTLQNSTLGFTSLFDFNDIYEHEYRIVHYFNSIEEQKSLLGPATPFGRQQKLIEDRLRSIKVSCFSFSATNNLMWSHYADQHKGVCYCFEKASIFEDKEFPWGKVQYSSSIPEVPIFQGVTTEGMLNAHLDSVILTKSLDWAYENENCFFKCQKDNFCTFNPHGLKAVIIGRRTETPEIDHIASEVSLFNKRHNDNVQVLFACRQPGSYALGLDEEQALRDSYETTFGASIPIRNDINTPLVTMEMPKN